MATELAKLCAYGESSYASLTSADGSYVQVAGGGAGCTVERHDSSAKKQYRAYTTTPVVSLPDGTELVFASGRIPLRHDEWLDIEVVTEIFGLSERFDGTAAG